MDPGPELIVSYVPHTHDVYNNHLTLPFVGIVKSRTNVNFTSYMCATIKDTDCLAVVDSK